ncbi:hypothetical protein Q31b_09070 [Novipirellula aureliae]|uniref:Uncharacterized protein n=1 Tax=Novipirellula aureliae TaxID=2527966 RepID=A0A5C6EDE8_9BACT|nr:hypothetical protein [Novipirellula aureliae]TWU45731.1 hypothetical protein Q31b_09070 [Novipirellula aureliae]
MICLFGVAFCGEPSVLRIVNAKTNFEPEEKQKLQGPQISQQGISKSGQTEATEPETPEPNRPQPCVLLKNGNVLFGTASQLGEFVVIAREDHSEIRLSRTDVACWAASVRDLYTYRVNQRSKYDQQTLLQARIEDIRWCLRYELFDLAALELIEVYAVAPEHREAQRLEKRLRDTAKQTQNAVTNAKEVVPAEIQQPAAERSTSTHASNVYDAVVESSTGLSDFARYVQPLLISHCGQCHNHWNASSGGTWRLTTPATGQRATARMTKENLKATLAQVDLASPSESTILTKAAVAHGDEQTEIDPHAAANRRKTTADALQKWIASVGRTTQHLRSEVQEIAEMDAQSLGQFADLGNTMELDTSRVDASGEDNSQIQREGSQMQREEETEGAVGNSLDAPQRQPARLPQVGNPFDPELFNRKYSKQ